MLEPAATDLQKLYRSRFGELQRRAKAEVWRVLVRQFFQQWVLPEHTVLDLGCGDGEFITNVACRRRIAVDMNPDVCNWLDPAVEFHQGSVCELPFLGEAAVDLIFTSNVMEHLSDKPQVETMLRECRRVLKPGGRLIAMGPNLRYLPGEYWDFWDHHVPITDRSLKEVLQNLDFRVEDCMPRFLPYTTCSSLPKNPWLVSLYLRLPLAWPWFGRQFLIRAQKQG
jgi:dolichol-phosphate mannosyltransferase